MQEDILKLLFKTWHIPMQEWGMFKDFNRLINKLDVEYKGNIVYPEKQRVFKVFKHTPYDDLKAVMMFQDPYHDGRATGIAVANELLTKDEPLSPTLRILMEEWQNDPDTGDTFDTTLIPWCQQGVLMLNTALTVKSGAPMSHAHMWRSWTEKFLVSLSMNNRDIVYVLFGKKAQVWEEAITNGTIIKVPHPAAEVYAKGKAGFYGSKVFSKVNENLKKMNKKTIVW